MIMFHISYFKLFNVPAYINVIWGSVLIEVIGEIQRHKNKHIFKCRVTDHSEQKFLVQLKVWS